MGPKCTCKGKGTCTWCKFEKSDPAPLLPPPPKPWTPPKDDK